jgi:hypothetical protein
MGRDKGIGRVRDQGKAEVKTLAGAETEEG